MVNVRCYHINIIRKDKTNAIVGLNKKRLEERYLKPYYEGHSIVTDGEPISLDDIEKIQIYRTEEDYDKIRDKLKRKREEKSLSTEGRLFRDAIWDKILEEGENVTDKFITGAPGSALDKGDREDEPEVDERKVFVVHGRNTEIKDSMFKFIRALDLHPIEWVEAIEDTGEPSPYIGDILDKAFSTAQAIVFLMTPDDEARLREEFRKEDDPSYETELTPQPRPNVLYEGGMAMAKHPNRTVIVKIGNIRPFSDIQGMHYVKLDNTPETRSELATKLENAGCPVDTSGTDWLDAGDFEIEED